MQGAAATLPNVSLRAPSSSRGIPVELPDRLGEPLVIRLRPWGRPYLAHPDGTELPTDPWGNRLAAAADGGHVRVRPALGQGTFGHAVFVNEERVELGPPLERRELGLLLAVVAVVAGVGVSLVVAGFWLFPRGAPTVAVFWAGLVIGYAGAWVAARQLRRRADPRRRIRAALTTGAAVLVALGLYAALGLALLGS
jgi:hypothetical protein